MKENFPDVRFVYNSQSVLCTNKPIHTRFDENIIPELFAKALDFISITDPLYTEILRCDRIYVTISPSKALNEIHLNDLEQYEIYDFIMAENSILEQLFQDILSTSVINKFLCVDRKYFYQSHQRSIANAFITRVSAHFNYKIVDLSTDSSEKDLIPLIEMTIEENLFYKNGNFRQQTSEYQQYCNIARIEGLNFWQDVERAFFGIKLSPINRPDYVFSFTGFTRENIAQKM